MKQFVWFSEGGRASPYITQFVASIHAEGFQDEYPATVAVAAAAAAAAAAAVAGAPVMLL